METQRQWEVQGHLWAKMFETALHSDRAAVDIGLFFLKVLMLTSGGALVSLIAAYPALRSRPEFSEVIPFSSKMLLGALVSGMLAAGVAYFYQSVSTADQWRQLHEIAQPEEVPPFRWARRVAAYLAMAMIAFAFASLILFCVGALSLLKGFSVPL